MTTGHYRTQTRYFVIRCDLVVIKNYYRSLYYTECNLAFYFVIRCDLFIVMKNYHRSLYYTEPNLAIS